MGELSGRHHINDYYQNRLIFFNDRSHQKIEVVFEQLCVQGDCDCKKLGASKLPACHLTCTFYRRLQAASQHNLKPHMELFQIQNIKHHYSRVQKKHLFISANKTLINFKRVYTGAFPDLVKVGLECDADFTIG